MDVFNGSRWTAVKQWAGDTGHWQYDTCASPTFCMMTDDFNHFAVFNGKSGRQLRSPIRTPGTEGHGFITCTSASFCAMPEYRNSQGYPITSGVAIFNGRSWSYHYLSSGGWMSSGVINQVACAPHSRFCIAMDYAGQMVSYDGSHWSRMAVTTVGHAQIVCPSSKFCLAVDGTEAAIGT